MRPVQLGQLVVQFLDVGDRELLDPEPPRPLVVARDSLRSVRLDRDPLGHVLALRRSQDREGVSGHRQSLHFAVGQNIRRV